VRRWRREVVRARIRERALRWIAFSGVFVGAFGMPRSALGDTGSFALRWSPSRDAPCVIPSELEEAVVAKLGRNPFVPVDRADTVLDGRELPASAGRRHARIQQRDHAGRILGTRALAAESCAELTRSAAFVIVLIVDPDALMRETPEAPSSPPPSVETEPPKISTTARPPPSPVRSRPPPVAPTRQLVPPIVHASAALTFTRGILPGGDAGGLVGLGLTPWPLPIRLDWRGSYRASLTSPRGRTFSAVGQEWRGCYLIRPRETLGGSACVGGAWATIFPQTSGLTDGDSTPKAVFGPVLGIGPALQAGTFALVADVSLFFPRPRWAFSYLNESGRRQALYELDRIVVAATLGFTQAF
jgi:hypothetical protein